MSSEEVITLGFLENGDVQPSDNGTLNSETSLQNDNMVIMTESDIGFMDDESTKQNEIYYVMNASKDTNTSEDNLKAKYVKNNYGHAYTFEKNEMYYFTPVDDRVQEITCRNNLVHRCAVCGKIFRTLPSLAKHLRKHNGEKPFVCEICDKRFSQQSNLWKHVHIHTGVKRYECTECDKKFSQKSNLLKHTLIHEGKKPFPCDICERSFSQRANLDKHIRTHTGEKPYDCNLCDKKFTQISNMRKHIAVHQNRNNLNSSRGNKTAKVLSN